ncbi:hypothetical protein V8B97DRAFT_1655461 [Scleroderma yunnanense]
MTEHKKVPDDLTGAPASLCRPTALKRPMPTTGYLAQVHTVVKRQRYSSAEPAETSGNCDDWKCLSFDRHGELATLSSDKIFVPVEPASSYQLPLTTQTLLAQLDMIFPGLGFKQSLTSMNTLGPGRTEEFKHQVIADFLAEKGLLNERVLNLLSKTKLHRLDLGPTMCDENGLNLQQSVVGRPGHFKDLTELSFDGGQLQLDFDLVHIQGLRQLKKLCLEATGIGNEAIFLLVSLKENLETLHLAFNPKIDDDSIPAIILFNGLTFLSIYGTSIGMPGLRKLTLAILKEGRTPAVEIPEACEKYIDNLDKQYLRSPKPPLVVDPLTCLTLSESALKRNLAAHATANPSILASETREEMTERLMKILETRRLDHLVCSLFTDLEESDTGE